MLYGINNRTFAAFSLQRTTDFVSAIAWWCGAISSSLVEQHDFIMPRYNRRHVWHTAITYFDVESVADLVLSVMEREVFSEQSQEFLADISFDMLAKRWVKPRDVTFPLLLFLGVKVICILQLTSVSALMHSLFVLRDCIGKFLAVALELR